MLERGKVVMIGTSNVLELKNTKRSHSEGFHHVKSHKTINIKLSRENCFGKLALGHTFFLGLLVASVISPVIGSIYLLT